MLLGQVAVTLRHEHSIISSVVSIFKQRMFYPTSNLDISMVNELAKMAAKTGVSDYIDRVSFRIWAEGGQNGNTYVGGGGGQSSLHKHRT